MKLVKQTFLFGLALALAAHAAHAESRTVPAFKGIELRGVAEVSVTVKKGAAISVDVSGDAALLPQLITEVKGTSLIVDTRGKLPNNSHLRVAVVVPDLAAASLSGTGELHLSGIANDKLALSISGTGELAVSGATNTLSAEISGTGELRAKDLAAKTASVEVSGTGSATITASGAVSANVTGTGDIEIYGHPSPLAKSVSGMGHISIR